MILEEKGYIDISITETPKTNNYGGYSGKWDADAGVTHTELVDMIKKKIGKPVKWVTTFSHTGAEEEKVKVFKGRGTWTAK